MRVRVCSANNGCSLIVDIVCVCVCVCVQPLMEVHRWGSKHLPKLDDPIVDWEETVYLNIIMHQVSVMYILT